MSSAILKTIQLNLSLNTWDSDVGVIILKRYNSYSRSQEICTQSIMLYPCQNLFHRFINYYNEYVAQIPEIRDFRVSRLTEHVVILTF